MGYVNLIRKVVGATPTGTGDYLVRSIDFDGTILKQEYVNHGQNATPMTHPTHDLLTADGYNNSYDNIQHDTDVGLIYKTTDGKTYLFMSITATTGKKPTIYLNKADTSLMTVTWGDGETITSSASGNVALEKPNDYAIGDYTVTIECAGNWSFYTSIFNNVADYNSCLLKLYLGNYVTSIGTFAFRYCYSLTSMIIPKSIAAIGTGIFSFCYSLTSLVIPNNGLDNIQQLFRDCHSLTLVVLPAEFTYMPHTFLFQCYSLTSIIIPDSIQKIDLQACRGCHSLTSLVIPYGVKNIEQYAFYECYSILKYVLLPTTPPSLAGTNAFTSINLACKIYVPDASLTDYQGATNWVTYANYFYPISQLAKWNGTIFFQCNGGNAIKQIRGTVGAVATEPTAPTKAGFTFDGWYKEVGLTTAWNWATDVYPATNLTLYAKWI